MAPTPSEAFPCLAHSALGPLNPKPIQELTIRWTSLKRSCFDGTDMVFVPAEEISRGCYVERCSGLLPVWVRARQAS